MNGWSGPAPATFRIWIVRPEKYAARAHVEELVLGHQAGAGERGEQAARLDHAQRQLVHVQVLLQRSDDLVAVAGHLRRVQDHHVVLLATIGRITQPREDVGLDELRAHVVQARIALGDLDDVFIDVDADHFRGASRRRVHRKTAGVAAQVQHALAFHLLAQPLAVLALVGEEAGLVRTGRVGAELDAVLGDHRRFGGGIAVEIELSCFCTCSSAKLWKRQPGNCSRRAS